MDYWIWKCKQGVEKTVNNWALRVVNQREGGK